MKTKRISRLWTALLSLVMVLALLPSAAFAAGGVVEVSNKQEFIAAFAKTHTQDLTIKLTKNLYDIVPEEYPGRNEAYLVGNTTVTIDLNGHYLVMKEYGDFEVNFKSGTPRLIIKDSSNHQGRLAFSKPRGNILITNGWGGATGDPASNGVGTFELDGVTVQDSSEREISCIQYNTKNSSKNKINFHINNSDITLFNPLFSCTSGTADILNLQIENSVIRCSLDGRIFPTYDDYAEYTYEDILTDGQSALGYYAEKDKYDLVQSWEQPRYSSYSTVTIGAEKEINAQYNQLTGNVSEISTINFSGLKPVEVGAAISDNHGQTITAHVDRTSGWVDVVRDRVVRGTFQENVTYLYYMRLVAQEGYAFSESFKFYYEGTLLPKLTKEQYNNNETGYWIESSGAVCVKIKAEDIIVPPLTITRQPQNVTVFEGETATFTVQVSGGKAPYTYEWYISTMVYEDFFDGTENFTVANANYEYHDGTYSCLITDADGNTIRSDYASLTVNSKPKDPCAAFTDINRDAWYHNAVDYAISNGLMAGMSATEFAPNGRVTRAQIVQILYNMEGKPAVTYTNKFTDVTSGDWFASAVLWAAEKGVVSGMGDGLFAPNANLTREQAATILYNYFTKRGDDTSDRADLSKFPDHQSVSSWALAPFQWANAKGIINGTNTGTQTILDPQGGTTRAQIAQIFFNISKL